MLHAVENDPRCWGAVAVRSDESEELVGCYPNVEAAEAAIVAHEALISSVTPAEPEPAPVTLPGWILPTG